MKNTNTYKMISVVGNTNGIALAMSAKEGQLQHMKKIGTNNLVASLKVLKSLLENIEDNSDNTKQARMIIVGSKSPVKGFATGTYVEYIRTGANASGKKFTEEEITLIKEVAQLYASRCLNVRITTDEFISKNDRETRELIDASWKRLNLITQEIKSQNKSSQLNCPTPNQAQELQDKTTAMIAKLQEEFDKAMEEMDLDKMDKITIMIERLSGKPAVAQETVEDPDMEIEVEC